MLTDDMTRLVGEIGAMRGARQGFMKDLMDRVNDLKEAVSDMQAGFRDALVEMSEKTRADLGGFVSDLKNTVFGMQAEFRDAHGEMSERTKADRQAFVSDLKGTVAGLRQDFAADIAGAHDAWYGRFPAEAPKAEREQVEREEAETEPQFSQETPEEGIPDDLTAIRGIGSALQGRLNDAGFYTYAQLAERTAEDLRRALGSVPPRANVEDWISQARELV